MECLPWQSDYVGRRGGPCAKARRSPSPLRLISWLTFGLPTQLTDLLEQLMLQFAQQSDPRMADINDILQKRFSNCDHFTSPEQVCDFIVQQIGAWNEKWQPSCLLHLFEGFLRRFSLPRLAHFLDMILPQLSPVHTRWDDPRRSLLRCHFFRLERATFPNVAAVVQIRYLFTFRAHTYIWYEWYGATTRYCC